MGWSSRNDAESNWISATISSSNAAAICSATTDDSTASTTSRTTAYAASSSTTNTTSSTCGQAPPAPQPVAPMQPTTVADYTGLPPAASTISQQVTQFTSKPTVLGGK